MCDKLLSATELCLPQPLATVCGTSTERECIAEAVTTLHNKK